MSQSASSKRKIVKQTVYSEAMQEDRELRIYVPPGYMDWSEYPVIYCQDGEQFFNFGRIATQMHRLIQEEYAEPALIVGVDVELKHRTEEYSPDGERFDAYCRFFSSELVPYIEQHFGTVPTKQGRFLAGDSLGGTVSLHLALRYPELFQQVISLSGAFLEPTQEWIEKASDLSQLVMYMLIGTKEQAVQTDRGTFDFLSANRKVRQLLEAKQAQIHYVEKEGKHIWGFWQTELPDALRYFFV